jgi:hypothetical protein
MSSFKSVWKTKNNSALLSYYGMKDKKYDIFDKIGRSGSTTAIGSQIASNYRELDQVKPQPSNSRQSSFSIAKDSKDNSLIWKNRETVLTRKRNSIAKTGLNPYAPVQCYLARKYKV